MVSGTIRTFQQLGPHQGQVEGIRPHFGRHLVGCFLLPIQQQQSDGTLSAQKARFLQDDPHGVDERHGPSLPPGPLQQVHAHHGCATGVRVGYDESANGLQGAVRLIDRQLGFRQ